EHLRSLPEYEEGNISADVENKIRNAFAGVGGAALTGAALTSGTANTDDSDFYNHDHFNEDNLYRNRKSGDEEQATIPVIEEQLQVGKREVAKGGIRLRSRIVENEVQGNINLREEKIHVERTPVDRAANVTDLKEQQIEVTERAEVPVVSKEARVVEEVSLSKEVTEKEESVKGTVRSTKVDIERTDNSDDLNTGSGTTRI
ncbi:MAG TPA: YsnF/AvaK domain-containing protein, partial [Segetibacter sp.]|nr:YsnF/AvaK domain-containing protein [Segetibacter sp.]